MNAIAKIRFLANNIGKRGYFDGISRPGNSMSSSFAASASRRIVSKLLFLLGSEPDLMAPPHQVDPELHPISGRPHNKNIVTKIISLICFNSSVLRFGNRLIRSVIP